MTHFCLISIETSIKENLPLKAFTTTFFKQTNNFASNHQAAHLEQKIFKHQAYLSKSFR